MKRLLLYILTIITIFSLVACSKAPTNQNLNELEKELGETETLPVDIDEAIGKIGKTPVKYQLPGDDGETLAVFDNTVLYSGSRTEEDQTDDGMHFTYTINGLYLGNYTSGKDNALKIQFVAAHLSMEISSDDVEASRKHLKKLLKDAPIDLKSSNLFKQLIDGKQIYITTDSVLWNEFTDVDQNIEVLCNSEDGTFEVKYTGQPGVLKYEETLDSQGRVISEKAYYYDENGKKYIESIEEKTYKDDGSIVSNMTIYYSYTEQVMEITETVSKGPEASGDSGVNIEVKVLKKLEYYKNGNLKKEFYDYSTSPDEPNFKEVGYYEDGQKTYEDYFDDKGDEIQIYYRTDGTVLDRFVNNQLVFSDRREQLPLEETLENGDKLVRTYVEDYLETEKLYSSSGVLYTEKTFYKSGRVQEVKSYDYLTGKIGYIAVYYDMENGTESKFITYDDPDWFKVETHLDTKGNATKEIYYSSETVVVEEKVY